MIFTSTELILLGTVAFFLIVQMIYYWGYLAQPYYRQRTIRKYAIREAASQPPVSVVIYAKNEAAKLEANLPLFLEQNYPTYEIIVVDDGSSDDTSDLLKQFYFQHKHFRYTAVPPETKTVSRKKIAVLLGVKAAQYEHILFSEANCFPQGKEWLAGMAGYFTEKKSIVLGFSSLNKCPSLYAAYDYFITNLQMVALAVVNHPYMGIGKNLGYTKTNFFDNKGFHRFNYVDAGEDDLLINEMANGDNVAVALSPQSVIKVDMEAAWMWREYKSRRSMARVYYRPFALIFWRFEQWSRILFWLSCAAACYFSFPHWMVLYVVLAAVAIRTGVQLFVFNRTAKLMNLPRFWSSVPVFDFIQPFVNLYYYLQRN